MRMPVVPQISTKDGISNKNARLTNVLKESSKASEKAVVRPGLVEDAQASGIGRGLVSFNGELISVYGTTLGLGVSQSGESGALSTITDTISADLLTECARFVGNTSWLFGGINTDTEEGELYVYDSSDDSTTLLVPGVGVADVTGIASNGTNVVVSTRPETFAGSPALLVADIATFTFSEVTGLTYTDPFEVKYGGGKFVAISTGIGQSGIAWSTDGGTTWSETTIATGKGRTLLYDGSAWWFFCGDGSSNISAYKTTDFVSFVAQSLSGLPGSTAAVCSSYKDGTYYLIANDLYTSANGLDWTTTSSGLSSVVNTSSGMVYGAKASTDTLYAIDGTSVTQVCADSFTGSYRKMDTNEDASILISPTYAASVVRVNLTPASGSIPALSTIVGDNYDFTQSVI